ncbi:alpha/beta fold hydrolase [Spartinivicinus poritis]|uniref:Alpha/beta fold hydrolase n=1 Tax=Spartinivicinus poritis TaxID=2994640 RepID=A0ABT5UDZ2_9GAMM|nr:alpha/beta fold hydrolase [Spartinivicinus sp. A2-2]MDE1464583.1 alpha/beta fold hydrolase [Spartinivicinus sp. A2-2]
METVAAKDISQRIKEIGLAIEQLEEEDVAAARRCRKQLAKIIGRDVDGTADAYIDFENMAGPNPIIGIHTKDITDTLMVMGKQVVKNPQLALYQSWQLLGDAVQVLLGNSDLKPTKQDKRFNDPTWFDNPFYKRYMQLYFAWCNRLFEWTEQVGFEDAEQRRSRFILSLITEALAPTNSLLNPAAIKRLFETAGESVQQGLVNLLDDWLHNGGMPAQVNKRAFSVGENLATTPGSVVFRNEVLELIQYKPITPQVYSRPLFIIPPQINKFYIFDLTPDKSFIHYALSLGIQVFVCSWRNPNIEHRDWGLETYIIALEDAIDATCEITSANNVNVLGACSGGITAATLVGYLQAAAKTKVNVLTLMVSVLDMNIDSDVALFATERSLAQAKSYSHRKGVLEGRDLAKVFAWMRPNDLVWNYWVNNYLLGYPPPAYDVLYWNNDTTRLPAELHGQFLDMYEENPFHHPGLLKICNEPIDLSQVECDLYAVAGLNDHITAWEACYRSTLLFEGHCDFILSNSGHVQCILNPPGNPKSFYYTNNSHPQRAEEWRKTASKNRGSWWDHWAGWIKARAGEQLEAPKKIGSSLYPPTDIAPGTYVHE